MLPTEYLSVSAIFLTGLLIGFKVKTMLSDFNNYIAERKKYN